MPRHLIVRHSTEYRYSEPVAFGRHRMMFRPRDSHSIRLLDTSLSIEPRPLQISWAYDVFGNSVAFAEFGDIRSDTLRFESVIGVLHYEIPPPTSLLLPAAASYPFAYEPQELSDLRPVMKMHDPDPDGMVADWATQCEHRGNGSTLAILTDMLQTIRANFQYRRRPARGTQNATETLRLGTGSCRDFALLMIDGLRSLGFAARFVSGYIYSSSSAARQGGGATHAWVQVYLPGCGWIEIDPTNAIFGNRDLIRVAVAREPKQASPLSGSFIGPRSAYLGMTINVKVSQANEPVLLPAT